MNLMTIEELTKSYGDKTLFEAIDFSISSGDRIGLIGRNGEGKTTFLRIIAGLEEIDSGSIKKPSDLKIEYLPQNVVFLDHITVLEQVFKGNSENMKTLRQYEAEVSKEEIDNNKILKLTEIMDRENLWELEAEAKTILTKLGILEYNKKVGELSGGQRRRVAIASALINDCDLLILDEPTNHLDNSSIEWLEAYLKNRKSAVLMVTHDRYFLDRVTTRIVELENKQLYSYDGNYNYFLEKKVERQEIELAEERKRKSLYKQELAWMKQGIKARGTRQKARVERFEELSNSKLYAGKGDLDISVSGHRLGRKIIELKNVSKSYGDKGVIRDFSYTLLRDDRIGILGENGSGKSTLLNLMTGNLELTSGSVEIGETVKVGYFAQNVKDMDENLRAIDYIKEGGDFIETSDGSKITAAQMMERFLFIGKEQYTPISKLSGGERRRLYLLRVLMEGPNVLILDEPTNDLDINTLQVLEDYIEEFPGPVIVVSHDRYLIDKIVDKIFYIKDGNIKEFPGNYTDFKEKIELVEEDTKLEAKEEKKVKGDTRRNRTLKFSFNEQREWDTIHKDIGDLEDSIEAVEKSMEEFAAEYTKLEELMKEKEELENKLDEKMERWLYLSELKEKIDAQ